MSIRTVRAANLAYRRCPDIAGVTGPSHEGSERPQLGGAVCRHAAKNAFAVAVGAGEGRLGQSQSAGPLVEGAVCGYHEARDLAPGVWHSSSGRSRKEDRG